MITNKDLIKLAEVFPTKLDLDELQVKVGNIELANQSLLTAIDNLVKAANMLKEDHLAFATIFNAHKQWIEQIAKNTNTELKVIN